MLQKLISTLRRHRFRIYTAPFQLNIVGIRSDSVRPNSFDDRIHVFFRDEKGKWNHYEWPITTDPGTYWLNSPIHPQGTAILKGNRQYVDAYSISLHQGKYHALCQRLGQVEVIRDYNRDSLLDFGSSQVMKGMFGINIHRAKSSGTTKEVQRYSAGCQVFANAADFNRLMQLCERHRKLHGNVFTYTLIDNREVRRTQKRNWLRFSLTALSATVIGMVASFQNGKEKAE